MGQEKANEKEALPAEKNSFFASSFIRFLGGKNLLYLLIVLLLSGCIIFIFDKIAFIFKPLRVLVDVVILPGILGLILYYLLRPFSKLFDRWKIPRALGILIIYLGVIGFLTLAIVLIYPFIRDQFTNLINEFPVYFMDLVEGIVVLLNNSRLTEFFETVNKDYNTVITDLTGNLITTVRDTVSNIASSVSFGVTSFITKLTGILLSLVIVPFVLFYLLYEGEKMPKFILRIFPPRMRSGVGHVLSDMDKQISSYIQGQILVSICIGTMVTIGFLIIGLKFALLIGLLAMVTSVVPYLGPVIAIAPAAVIAIVTGGPFMLLKLGIVWTIVQLVEGKFISPQIMGRSLSIHPISIIFVLLTAGALFGIPGVILGLPGYALIKVLVQHSYALFKIRFNRFQTEKKNEYEIKKIGDH